MNELIKQNYNMLIATKRIPYIIAVWVPFHILAIYGLISGLIFWHSIYIIYLILGWAVFGGIGTSIMLHRYFSHKSIKLRPYLKFPLYWISCMAGHGSPIWWAALHIGYHHSHSDRDRDIHSPIVYNFWYAYIGWIFKIKHDTINLRYASNCLRDTMLIKFHKHYNSVIWISLIVLTIINPMFALWFYVIPAVIDLHTNGLINSVCHTKNRGYKWFNTNDMSQNVWYLGLFDWGQGWHNNHHYNPKSFDFGSSISKKWYEFDPCLLWVPIISPISETKRIFKIWSQSWRG